MIASSRHSVLLVEDDEPTRARLAGAVREHDALRLLAAVGTVAAARRELVKVAPDVLLTDLGLPDGNGVDLIRTVRETAPATQCMVVTVFGDEQHVVSAIEAGALGYLLKDGSPEYIGSSIMELLGGGSPISPPIARYLLKRFRPGEGGRPAAIAPAPDAAELPHLSDRETEVLTLIVKGFSYAESGRLLGVSTHTVTTHVRNVYRKLEVHSRGEAVYEALQMGLVKLED